MLKTYLNKIVEITKKIIEGTDSLAIGNESQASLNNSIALGYQSKTDYDVENLGKVYTPKGSVISPTTNDVGIVSVGSKDKPRRIVNAAAGYLDNDVVTVVQLKALEQTIEDFKDDPNNIIPYFSVDHIKGEEVNKISSGIKADKNYKRYVELANQYAMLLNRQKNGKESISKEAKYKI